MAIPRCIVVLRVDIPSSRMPVLLLHQVSCLRRSFVIASVLAMAMSANRELCRTTLLCTAPVPKVVSSLNTKPYTQDLEP